MDIDIKDQKLLTLALTHRSYLNENAEASSSNERLEFLGDAVLELITSEELYKRFPEKDEGFLTALRANIVNTKSLAALARELNLGEKILLSKGEEASGGRSNESLLADTVESIIGALYMDGGFTAAKRFIVDNLLTNLDERAQEPLKDPKSLLQELVQSKKLRAPVYRVVGMVGPDHKRHFTVEVLVNGESVGKGEGSSKSEAEQNSAKAGLEKLSSKD